MTRAAQNPKSKIQNAAVQRKGFVLIAVLVVVGSAILVATGLLFIAQGRAADTAGAAESAQSRALAWSGVQVVMGQLNDQRERILNGELPRLDRQYTIYETRNRLGVIRLLPMSPGGDSLLSPEAGKLDLNSITAENLAKTGMIDPAIAAAVVSYRDQKLHRPFQSESELLNVPGGVITPTMFYGSIDQIKPRDQAQHVEGDLAERVLNRLQPQTARGVADIATVFSVETLLQKNGSPQINKKTHRSLW